ncbi:hypothetical protein LEP1GSC163_2739 [Leptospira santarosai str. CBC379]|nr:hypothetical protein LEP1GSC163_2739 [Leptospira santarosai str. CBC379]
MGFGIFDEFWEDYCVSLSPAFEFKMWELLLFRKSLYSFVWLTRIFFNGTTKQKNKTQTIIPKEPSLESAGDSCDWVGLQSERMSISRKVCRPADSILMGRNSVLNFTGIFDFQGAT